MWLTIAIISGFATVTMANASNSAGKKNTPSSAGSPRRKVRTGKGNLIDKKETMKKPNSCFLKICKFHENFSFEMIIYERTDGEDGYLHLIRQFTQGEVQNDELKKLGIVSLLPRRNPDTNNDIMLGTKKGYWRQLIIRYVDEPSTPETRNEALCKLKSFFLNPNFTKYPPPMIETMDITDSENPRALDDFFLDKDIESLLKEDFEEEDLNGNFTRNFTEFAKICWSHDHVSEWARSLGFPISRIETLESSKQEEKESKKKRQNDMEKDDKLDEKDHKDKGKKGKVNKDKDKIKTVESKKGKGQKDKEKMDD